VLRVASVLPALGLAACALHRPSEPVPGQPPHLAAMTSVVERVRRHPPRRGFSLALAPVTVNYEEERYPLRLRPEFGGAVADLVAKRGRLDPIGPSYLAGVPVRRPGEFDPYDTAEYLLVRLSPVGFSPDSTRAALLVVFDCGPGCGSQVGVGLRRASNGGWRIAQYQRLPDPPPPAGAVQPPR